jgi:hypothetical protein
VKFPFSQRQRCRGAVLLWVLLALVLGVLLGWGGFSWWGGGGGPGPGGNGQGRGAGQPGAAVPPEQPAAGAIRITQAGVEWRGETVPFTDLQRLAELIAKTSDDPRVRVIYAADVDHLNEKRVQDVLRSAGVKEIPIHEE